MRIFRLMTVVALIGTLFVASCANTMRGMGRDVGNTVDATEDAAEDVVN